MVLSVVLVLSISLLVQSLVPCYAAYSIAYSWWIIIIVLSLKSYVARKNWNNTTEMKGCKILNVGNWRALWRNITQLDSFYKSKSIDCKQKNISIVDLSSKRPSRQENLFSKEIHSNLNLILSKYFNTSFYETNLLVLGNPLDRSYTIPLEKDGLVRFYLCSTSFRKIWKE